jgi:hypothetical protein
MQRIRLWVSPLVADYSAAGLQRDASLFFAEKNRLQKKIIEYTLSPLSFKACPVRSSNAAMQVK